LESSKQSELLLSRGKIFLVSGFALLKLVILISAWPENSFNFLCLTKYQLTLVIFKIIHDNILPIPGLGFFKLERAPLLDQSSRVNQIHFLLILCKKEGGTRISFLFFFKFGKSIDVITTIAISTTLSQEAIDHGVVC
jgi:hypothetical protein